MSGSTVDDYISNVLYTAINWSATVLVVYEHMITLQSETAMAWRKRLPAAPVMFLLLIRYSLLAFVILNVLPPTPTNCVPIAMAQGVFYVFQAVFNSAFATLRAYAIYPQSRIYMVVLGVGLVPVAGMIWLGAWNVAAYTYDDLLGPTCDQYFTGSDALFGYIMNTSNGCIIFTELLVFAETCFKIWRDGRTARKMLGTKTIYSVMLENGAVYFGGQVIMNVVISLPIQVIPGGCLSGTVMPFINVLPSILISRFLLNLREASGTTDTSHKTPMTRLEFRLPTTLQSALSIGNMGASLEHFPADEDEDEAWEVGGREEDGMRSPNSAHYSDDKRDGTCDWEEAAV